MDGSSVVLHTRFSRVVFPAFALPITRMRKQVYLARIFAASSGSIVTAGVGAAGDRGTGSSSAGGNEAAGGDEEAGGDDAAGGGEEAGRGRVTGGGKRMDRGAVTTGGAAGEGEFERLWGALRDPSRIAFFSRLKTPLGSLVVFWRSSAISTRGGDNKSFVWATHDNRSLPIHIGLLSAILSAPHLPSPTCSSPSSYL